MAKFPPLFCRVDFDSEQAGRDLHQTQCAFEAFWRSISNKCPQSSEKTLAMRKMQESCMWFTRAIALSAFDSGEPDIHNQSQKCQNEST